MQVKDVADVSLAIGTEESVRLGMTSLKATYLHGEITMLGAVKDDGELTDESLARSSMETAGCSFYHDPVATRIPAKKPEQILLL